MNIDELSVSAAKGAAPEGMTMPERAVWYPLRDLYADVKAGRLTVDGAKTKKLALSEQYERDNAFLIDAKRAKRYNADLWARIAKAATDYAGSENRTPEGDAFYRAVYGISPGIGTAGNMEDTA